MTFNEIKSEYIEYKQYTEQIKASSLAVIQVQYRTHISPLLGDMDIADVRTRHLQEFADGLIKKELSTRTVRDIVGRVKNIIQYVQWKYEIPCYKFTVVFPKKSSSVANFDYEKVFTPEEQKSILLEIINNPKHINMCISLLFFCGCRIGELCALKWSDFNADNNSIMITKTLERIYIETETGHKTTIIEQTAKTASSRREVPVPEAAASWLRAKKQTNLPYWYILSEGPKPIEPRTLREHYKVLIADAGVRYLSPHKMRHSYATNLICSGADIKTVSALLGHADTSVTLQIYTHIDIEQKRKAVQNFFGKQSRKKRQAPLITLRQLGEKIETAN